MPAEEREERHRVNFQYVISNSAEKWGGDFLRYGPKKKEHFDFFKTLALLDKSLYDKVYVCMQWTQWRFCWIRDEN